MKSNKKSDERLSRLRDLCGNSKNLLIVLQDHPDPDAVASGVALRFLANRFGLNCSIAHGGMVGRAENRSLINYLGVNLRRLDDVNLDSFGLIALVDTQPETGNNQLPEGVRPQIVIDHHPCRAASRGIAFSDIRSGYGATSTIMCEYLQAGGVEPEPPLATALLFGILSDTSDLGRETSRADIEAHHWLNSHANLRMLSHIRRSPLNCDYYKLLYQALANARVYGARIFVDIGEGDNPDMAGEIADLLVRKEKALWCLCLIRISERIVLSLRGVNPENDAGTLVRQVVAGHGTGGGHLTFAGGQISTVDLGPARINAIVREVRKRFLTHTGAVDDRSRRLVRHD